MLHRIFVFTRLPNTTSFHAELSTFTMFLIDSTVLAAPTGPCSQSSYDPRKTRERALSETDTINHKS